MNSTPKASMSKSIPESWRKAFDLAQKAHAEGKTVVTTNGCFDLLHKGHVSYLREAKKQGDFLFVGINADASVRAIKGPSRPINSESDRAYVIEALEMVDAVCVFEEETPENLLRALKPNVHVKGADWKGKNIPEESIVKEWGGRVHYAGFVDGYSSTKIIAASKKS